MSYAQTRKDFEFLESLAELYDQVELDARREELMQTPTRAKAAELYRSAISLWFVEHGKREWSNHYVTIIEKRYGETRI